MAPGDVKFVTLLDRLGNETLERAGMRRLGNLSVRAPDHILALVTEESFVWSACTAAFVPVT